LYNLTITKKGAEKEVYSKEKEKTLLRYRGGSKYSLGVSMDTPSSKKL